MADSTSLLAFTAASVGCLHTLAGPDHYLPFIVLSKARKWTLAKTVAVTLGCGLGHVLASVVLGAVGIALGLTVSRLNAFDSQRGDAAAWLLITLGLIYGAWGLHRARRAEGPGHAAQRADRGSAGFQSRAEFQPRAAARAFTPWMLFVVFVLGPCEPLIPVLMVPGSAGRVAAVAFIAGVFAAATLATMVAAVLLGSLGVSLLTLAGFERYSHALAGAALVLCGVGVRFLGL